jgi:DNA-binding CsgD family transcriptional regulator
MVRARGRAKGDRSRFVSEKWAPPCRPDVSGLGRSEGPPELAPVALRPAANGAALGGGGRGDYVRIIESIYRIEEAEDNWLSAIAESARASLGPASLGAYAFSYDASDVTDMRMSSIGHTGLPADLLEHMRGPMHDVYGAHPEAVDAVFRRVPHGLSTELPLHDDFRPVMESLGRWGIGAILGLNGVSVDGRSAHVGLFLARPRRIATTEVLTRISTHLAAGSRLRRRLQGSDAVASAEAVVDPEGRVKHAQGGAKVREAREVIAGAVRQIERLRGRMRREEPERALAVWRALVESRWSLVDHFERDGRRYLLAQRNDPHAPPVALLTDRERQVVALAALGHATKAIAYELGITVSTVGVLLGRAARRLGVRSRRELIAAVESSTASAQDRWF